MYHFLLGSKHHLNVEGNSLLSFQDIKLISYLFGEYLMIMSTSRCANTLKARVLIQRSSR